MELLDSSKTKIAALDETTSRVVSWGGIPAFVFYTGTYSKGVWTNQKMYVYKLEVLAGYYLKTDAGTEVQIPTTATVKEIAALLKEYGFNVGSTIFNSNVSKLATKTYAKLDTKDKGIITITVNVNAPADASYTGDTTLKLNYPRSVNAVTIADVLTSEKLPAIDGYTVIGASIGSTGSEDTIVTDTDKLLEDQEITLVWGKAVTVNFVKYVKYSDATEYTATETKADIVVAYGSKISEAVAKAEETIKASDTETAAGVAYSTDVTTNLTSKQLKKTVNTIAEGTSVVLKFDSTEATPTTSTSSSSSSGTTE